MGRKINWEEKIRDYKQRTGKYKKLKEKEFFEKMLDEYLSCATIADKIDVAPSTLRLKMKQLKIPIYSYPQQVKRGIQKKKKFLF